MTLLRAGLVVAVVGALPAAAVAQTTWSATPTSGLWNLGTNWAGGSAPTTGTTAANSLVFATSNITTTTNNFSSGTFNSITFNSGAPSYTLSGSALTLTQATSQVLNNSSNDQTINLAITGPANTELRSPTGWIIVGAGGSVTAGTNLQMGWNGATKVKVDGGLLAPAASVLLGRGGNTSTLWVTSGTVTTQTLNMAAVTNNSTGILNLDGGLVQAPTVQFGGVIAATGLTATINQAGGTWRFNSMNKTLFTSGTTTLNFTSGTIAPVSGNMSIGSGTAGLDRFILNGSGGTILTSDTGGVARTVTISAGISETGGARGLTFAGSGTTVLSGSNSYTGTTTIAGGALSLGGTNALAGGGNVTFSGGTLQSGSNNTLDYSSRIVSSGSAIAIDTNSQAVTWAGNVASTNTGGLTKLGSGTLTLSGSNAYTGATTIAGGVLALGGTNALAGGGNVTFSGGTLVYSANNRTDLSGRIVSSGSAIAINTAGQNVSWGSTLASTNTGGLTKTGNGTLTLSASNAFTGTVTVNNGDFVDGQLIVNHAAALGGGTQVTVTSGGLVLGGGITTGSGKTITVTGIGGSRAAGGLSVTSGTGTWEGAVTMSGGRLGYDGGSLVITGSVGGSGLTLSGYGDTNVNSGANSLTLAGPAGYTGATAILRGRLRIGADNTLPGGTTLDVFSLANSGAAQAATFDLNGFNQTVAGLTSTGNNGLGGFANGYVTNSAGGAAKTFTVDQATSGTYTGLITGNLAFTKSGAGNLTLVPLFVTTSGSNLFVSGTNTFTGDTRVNGGTLTLSTAAGSTSLALAGSTFDSDGAGSLSFGTMTAATFGGLKGAGSLALQNGSSAAVALTVGANGNSSTYSGALSGAGSLTKTGAGTLTLTGPNTYTGATTVSEGILALGVADAISNSTAVTVNGGGLDTASFNDTVASLAITSGSVFGAGTLTAATYGLGGGTVAANLGGGTLNVTGNSTLSGAAAATAVNLNAGTLTLVGAGRLTGNAAVSGSAGAALALGGNESIASLAGIANVNLGSSRLTVGDATSTTYSGVLSGAGGSLTKTGAGRLLLAGANLYSGTTTIAGGTLALDAGGSFDSSSSIIVGNAGSSGVVLDLTAKTGSFDIGAGQTLGGGGTVQLASSGTLNVLGLLSPGNSPGLLTFDAGTTLLSGTTLMEIWGTSRATNPSHDDGFYDAIDVIDGGLTFGGLLQLSFDQPFSENSTFNLFTPSGGGSLSGNFSNVAVVGSVYNTLTWSQSGTKWTSSATPSGESFEFNAATGNLTFVVVPEPGALALAGLGIAAAAWVRRRRS